MFKNERKRAIFDLSFRFGHLDWSKQKELRTPGLLVCSTYRVHAMTYAMSYLGASLRHNLASKQKIRENRFSTKMLKKWFLQVLKPDRCQQRREIWGPNLNHQHQTKMHCCHLDIKRKLGWSLEIQGLSCRQSFWPGQLGLSNPYNFLKIWI